eukprot:GHVT01062734.1.p1 GENE.GHVT01062734.1~~GHVT01062734.1.p1  ORF type:complete len:132 (+),score=17.91 GHVT01062734.1:405-800(+)
MDISRLQVGAWSFAHTADGATYTYSFTVSYGNLRWTVTRRFSDFAQLHADLLNGSGAGVDVPALWGLWYLCRLPAPAQVASSGVRLLCGAVAPVGFCLCEAKILSRADFWVCASTLAAWRIRNCGRGLAGG